MVTEVEAATSPTLRDEDGRPRCFPATGRPISTYDTQMRQLEKSDPQKFAVERWAQWATVSSPYLNPAHIAPIFGLHNGERLMMKDAGILSADYVVVVDPAAKHDAFAWAIGHREPADEEGRPHAVIDCIRRWLPADYGGELILTDVLDALERDVRAFRAANVVTDQYGGIFVAQDLNRRLYNTPRPGHGGIREQPRTRDRNLETAARFREAIYLGQVHCFAEPQLERELRFLREINGRVAAPTSGPVQTDDVAVAVMVLVEELLGPAAGQPIFDALGGAPLGGRPWPAQDPNMAAAFNNTRGARRSGPPRLGERSRPAGPKRLPPWATR